MPRSAPSSPDGTSTTSCTSTCRRAKATSATKTRGGFSSSGRSRECWCATNSRRCIATRRCSSLRAVAQRSPAKGFFALVRAVSFAERQVLPHEKTLTGPKLDRMKLSRATRATLSPQFMLYSDPERRLDADLDGGEPYADFSTPDGVRHRSGAWRNPDAVARVVAAIGQGNLLIADGHHRYETAVALAEEIGAEAQAAGRRVSPHGEHLYTYALLDQRRRPEPGRLSHASAGALAAALRCGGAISAGRRAVRGRTS